MCGIVGYIGTQQAGPLLLEGLTRLEHRGYDSAGVAVLGAYGSALKVAKQAGRVRDLAEGLPKRFAGQVGIGHTRWATHGPATDVNAHPHTDAKRDWSPSSTTASSTTPRRCGRLLADEGVDLVERAPTPRCWPTSSPAPSRHPGGPGRRRARPLIEGTYGARRRARRLPRPDRRRPQRQPADHRRRREEMHIASDLAALVRYTTTVAHLDDGEMATVTASGFTTYRQDLATANRGADHRHRPGGVRRGRRARPVHAQGDPRAAALGRARAARSPRRAVRHRPPRRPEHGRARDPGDPAGEDPRLRLGVLRRPDGGRAGRGARAHPGGRRGRPASSATATRSSSRTRCTSPSASPARPSTPCSPCRRSGARAAG